MSSIVLILLFAVIGVCITIRPFGVNIGWYAIIGAAIALIMGLVSLSQGWSSLASTFNVLSFFGGLIILTAILKRVGVLELLLDHMEKWSGDSPRRLLLATMLVTIGITAIFSNDAAALLIVPSLITRLRFRKLPLASFVLSVAIMANSASLLLPISNPVNLLFIDRNHILLSQYLNQITPGACMGLMLTALLIFIMSWHKLGRGQAGVVVQRNLDMFLVYIILFLLFCLAIIDIAFAAARWPLGPPTLGMALMVVIVFWVRIDYGSLVFLKTASWSLLPLIMGLAILSAGLQQSLLLTHIANVFFSGASNLDVYLKIGMLTGVLAAIINNIPVSFLVDSGLLAVHHFNMLIAPIITGIDLGPNLAPMGSLSTILIFAAIKDKAERPGWMEFCRLSVTAGVVGLIGTLAFAAFL